MGIIDFFRRNKRSNEQVNYSEQQKNYDCSLQYSSGIRADVTFKDLEDVTLDDGTIKRLQRVHVIYNKPDNTFEGKNMYMDPISDENGNNITKESYLGLLAQNTPLVKGFFAREQLAKEPTDYIGHIAYNNQGKPYRGKDINFERSYKAHLDRKRAREHAENEARFNEQLQEQVNNAPFHDDTGNQPEDLSKYTYHDPYDHSRNNDGGYTR